MTEYILDHMSERGIDASSQEELARMEEGISRYLRENGIDEKEDGLYYRGYVDRHLRTIAPGDLKAYFIHYALISDVNQIAIEYRCDGCVLEDRKRTLYQLMEKLYSCGLGEKYIPVAEVKEILGSLS